MMASHQIVCFGPSLAASLKPLAPHGNGASLSFFYSYCFGRFLSELAELVPLPHLCGSLIGCIIFLLAFLDRYYREVYVNSFFPCTARLWNSLPAEYFPLTYDLNDFKSKVNRHLLSLGSFSATFFYDFHIFLLFLVTASLVMAVYSCIE